MSGISYADKMLRGISSKSFIVDGSLTDDAFQLDPIREDGFHEISITWYECEEALKIIMGQINERTGMLQFQGGISELDRREIEKKMKGHILAERLKYEKDPTENNIYHGNLLINGNLNKQLIRLIRCGLATLGSEKIYPLPE